MAFWIPSVVIMLLVAAALALAPRLARRNEDHGEDVGVYRDQLKEVDRDRERGVLSAEDAEAARIEISRRLLDAGRREAVAKKNSGKSGGIVFLILIAALVGPGSYALYQYLGAPGYPDLPLDKRIEIANSNRENRPSQEAAESTMPVEVANQNATERYLELITQLRAAVSERPDELQGQSLLARHEAALGFYTNAYAAQEHVLRLKGNDAVADDWANYADLLILAAGGYISPEAERALNTALDIESDHPTARYYIGLSYAQTGRPDVAFGIWEKLLDESEPDDPWVTPIRTQLPVVAMDAGIKYELPPVQGMPGPDAGDVAAAADMTADERTEMIQSMVQRLSERLAEEGGTAEEWARLINALGVLGQPDRAKAIWQEAQSVFEGRPEDLAKINAAGQQAGVTE